MATEFQDAYRKARGSYERGRVFRGVRNATAIALVAWVLSRVACGGDGWAHWLPVTVLAIAVAEWRGSLFMAGARRGVCAGLASMLLPLSILRPCCGDMAAKGMAAGATCCTMPSVCWLTGGFVGLAMALLLPQAPAGRRWEAPAGMLLGITSLAILRCSSLFIGEAIGLLGGIAAGVTAANLARLAVLRLRTA
jgi:hypothetical protein